MGIKTTYNVNEPREIKTEEDREKFARLARGEMFACPKCGEPLEFGAERCSRCQTFLDPVTGQVRTEVSDEELHKGLQEGVQARKKGQYTMIAGAVVAVVGYLINGTIGLIIIIVGVVLLAKGLMAKDRAEGEYKEQLGQTMIPKVLSDVFDDVAEYSTTGHISNDIINRTAMFFPFEFDEIEGSDYIRATYKGVALEMSDITLVKVERTFETDENGHQQEREDHRVVFQGQWITCDFHKELTADLYVFEGGRRKGQIETENEAFNQKYGISCASAHEAFYILTPHMMENLLAMDERAGGDTYMRFMKEGKVHLAINSGRDNFEVGNMKNTNVDDLRNRFQDEIKYITDVVDLLLSIDTMYKK